MRMSISRAVASSLAIGLLVIGCSAAPAATLPVPVTPTPSDTPTEAPTDTPTVAPTDTPTPVASDTATPSPTPEPTAAPVQTPGAPGDPTNCTDWAKDGAYFTGVAKSLPFGVYCASQPSGWIVNSTTWQKPKSGGWITIAYRNKSKTQTITVGEGDFCSHTADPSNCWSSSTSLGTANFGDLSGALVQLAGGEFAVFVNANTKTGYQIVGKGMTQSAFVSMAAAMVHIPKS
jgi:hypothetical protein